MKEKIKAIGISGSPREGRTNYMIKTVLNTAGCDYEIINLKDRRISPCNACGGCYLTHECIVADDMQEIRKKLEGADVIIFGSPTYFANVSGIMKNFIDRCLPMYLAETLKDKRVGLVTVGNFNKGEVRWLDDYDPEEAAKTPEGRRKTKKTIKRCVDILKFFCKYHMQMKVVGEVSAIGAYLELEEDKLIKLGKKLAKIKILSKNYV